MKQLVTGFGFFSGVSYPLATLKVLLKNPQCISYVIIPVLVNVVLAIFFYGIFLYYGWQVTQNWLIDLTLWFEAFIDSLPQWLDFLTYFWVALFLILRLLVGVIFLGVTGFIFAQFGVLLGSPWYGKLSEKLEQLRTGTVTIIEVGIIKDIWRAIAFELKKLILSIFIGIPLLLCNLFPGIGTLISTIGGITLTATLTGLDFLDAPLERRRFPFHQKIKLLWLQFPSSAGFSLVSLFLISIPLINLITIPICVASGTLFFCDRILPTLNTEN
ncbi:MAG: EI24 domain-containing protein [Microcystaceae cyanobacterium]